MFVPFKLVEFPEIAILLFTAYLVSFNLLLPSIPFRTVCIYSISFPFHPIIFPLPFQLSLFSLFNILQFLRDCIFLYFLRMSNSCLKIFLDV